MAARFRVPLLERIGRRGASGARADDAPDVVARRLALYEEQEARILQAFDGLTPVLSIDATKEPIAVTTEILSALDRLAPFAG